MNTQHSAFRRSCKNVVNNRVMLYTNSDMAVGIFVLICNTTLLVFIQSKSALPKEKAVLNVRLTVQKRHCCNSAENYRRHCWFEFMNSMLSRSLIQYDHLDKMSDWLS
jgi:hypothetical protein